jgi:hypothetical protein
VAIRTATAMYACSARHFRRMLDRGLVPAPVRLGHALRWRLGDLRAHIREGCPKCR